MQISTVVHPLFVPFALPATAGSDSSTCHAKCFAGLTACHSAAGNTGVGAITRAQCETFRFLTCNGVFVSCLAACNALPW